MIFIVSCSQEATFDVYVLTADDATPFTLCVWLFLFVCGRVAALKEAIIL
jgi:hypothetical protein